MTGQLSELASEAYVFGFPLVFNGEQILRLTTSGIGALPSASFNSFSHARALASPRDTFVSINNDTVYSIAPVDLSVGPVLLSVPEAGDRYYVLQFVDAWTNNFAYVGTRATGNRRGDFLLVPPEWEGGPEAEGVTVIRFPTRIAVIVGRWACDGEEDLPAVEELQNSLTLTPIRKSLTPPQGVPVVAGGLSEALDFFERLRVWALAFPPAERDRAALDSYGELGLTSAYTVAEAPAEVRDALEVGYAAGKQALEMAVRSGDGPYVNNWLVNLHMFDYNLDFFEVGTLDDPAWKHADAKTRYATRAAAALAGLWGNHGYGYGGFLRRPSASKNKRSWFLSALARADLERLTPHDLRHTAASLAVSSGANVKAVQRMLGHKSAAMTLDTYADLFDDDLDEVAMRLNEGGHQKNVGKVWAMRAEPAE